MAVALALSASLLYGVANYLGPTLSRRAPLFLVLAVGQGVALAVSGALAVGTGAGTPDGAQAGMALLAGVGNAVGLLCFYRATQLGPLSLVTPIGALGAAVPVAVGIADGEAVSTLKVAGIVLAIGGVALAARRSGTAKEASRAVSGGAPEEARFVAAGRASSGTPSAPPAPAAVPGVTARGPVHAEEDRRAAIVWSVVSAVAFGVFLSAMAPAAEDGVLWAVFLSRVSLLAITVATALVLRQALRAPASLLPELALPGVLLFAGTLAYSAATREGDLSVVSVVGSLFPVVTVGLAFLLLGERLSRLQSAGVVGAMLGVVLLSMR